MTDADSLHWVRDQAEKAMNAAYVTQGGTELTRLLVAHAGDTKLRNALLTLLVCSSPKGEDRSVAYYVAALCDLIELRKYAPAQPGEDFVSNRFNTLCRGEPRDVIEALEEEPADEQELRAALQNAFQRIQRLERDLAERNGHG